MCEEVMFLNEGVVKNRKSELSMIEQISREHQNSRGNVVDESFGGNN